MFDLLLLRLVAAWADPERPGAMAGANERGSTAGATRNAAARNAMRRLRDIISSLGRNDSGSLSRCNAGSDIKEPTTRISGPYGGRSRAAIQASARYAASITASTPTTVRPPP